MEADGKPITESNRSLQAARAKTRVQYGLSRLRRLRSVNWADMTGPLPSRRPITYILLYVSSLAVEEDSQ